MSTVLSGNIVLCRVPTVYGWTRNFGCAKKENCSRWLLEKVTMRQKINKYFDPIKDTCEYFIVDKEF